MNGKKWKQETRIGSILLIFEKTIQLNEGFQGNWTCMNHYCVIPCRNLQQKYKCTASYFRFYFLLSSPIKIYICCCCWTISGWICCCIIVYCSECAWLCCVKILKTLFDVVVESWNLCHHHISIISVLSFFFNFNSFSQNSLSYSYFSLRNEEVSLLPLLGFFSDDGPRFNTCCDSFRFFITISCMSRGFCLSASTRAFFCSVICSCVTFSAKVK